MGRDGPDRGAGKGAGNFNPLSPHGERHGLAILERASGAFQSTLPAWGETEENKEFDWEEYQFQSTLPAWGETKFGSLPFPAMPFQSTLPAWGETLSGGQSGRADTISIHSPRMGRDRMLEDMERISDANFNPLSPHGERLERLSLKSAKKIFQSTLPAWGETK